MLEFGDFGLGVRDLGVKRFGLEIFNNIPSSSCRSMPERYIGISKRSNTP